MTLLCFHQQQHTNSADKVHKYVLCVLSRISLPPARFDQFPPVPNGV